MVDNKDVMAKNIIRLMNLKGVTATDVYTALGFKQNTFSDWINAKTYPRIDKIEMMADYFGVTKADLVEAAPDYILSDSEKNLIKITRDNESIKQVLDYAEFISKQKGKKL